MFADASPLETPMIRPIAALVIAAMSAAVLAQSPTRIRGTLEKVRKSDGVHLERAGGDIVAAEVMRELERRFELRG